MKHRGRIALLGCLVACWLAASVRATDVAFWTEYRPDPDDLARTYALAQFNAGPVRDAGAVEKVELIGQAQVVAEGRFGKALKVDGRSGARCAVRSIFEGATLSVEAWVKLERYPERQGYVVLRPGVADQDPAFNPATDKSKGFALSVDRQGALHFEALHLATGKRTLGSSNAAAVPTGKWAHVAGVSAGAAVRLYVDGKLVAEADAAGLGGESESQPQPIYVGCDPRGQNGLTGWIDQVRVHRNVLKFWEREDARWADPAGARKVAGGPPYFVEGRQVLAHVALDGDARAGGTAGANVELTGGEFVPGVRGKAYAGVMQVSAPGLFNSDEGTLEFWLRPKGINSASDRNRYFLTEPFVFYLLNGGAGQPSLHLHDDELGDHFIQTNVEMHPGRWFHLCFTWRDRELRVFVDGKQEGRTYGRRLTREAGAKGNRFGFNTYGVVGVFDEIRVYGQALLPEEVANAYWRYRDPSKLKRGLRAPAVQVMGEYLPSRRELAYELMPLTAADRFADVVLALRDEKGRVAATWTEPWKVPPRGALRLPELADGSHTLKASVKLKDGRVTEGGEFRFYHRRFDWTGNTLGMTEEVFPPFEPVKTSGASVAVVSRSMKMNGFGLWDEVESLGRSVLAGPMAVRFETAAGPGQWKQSGGRFVKQAANETVYEASSESDAVILKARSVTEVDGCLRVEMTLAPGPAPEEVRKLWVEVPLKESEAPLMHVIADGLRYNYSGATPAGSGVVWDGSKQRREEKWRNAFIPYIWLGGPERGIAFFAENDKGWVTEKGRSKTPTHELVREQGRLTLRVYLINRAVTLDAPRQLVFGVQASPTKPLPADWRARTATAPGGLAVVPWGGLQCASQGPYADDWSIAEKVLDVRQGKPYDKPWMVAYQQAHRLPRVHGYDWLYLMDHFGQRAAAVGPQRPLAVYQEEMRAAHSRPEWVVYQDEWKPEDGPAARTEAEGLDLRGGHRSQSNATPITFPRSYVDFGVWMADQWLKRGVSLYWDNTYLYASYNTRTTAAYVAEDGFVQPAMTIWNVREYHKRVWNLLQQRRRERPEPLEWTLHMTNTQLLPIHTWGTVQFNHELELKRPLTPEYLLTESTGRQTGNMPLTVFNLLGRDNEIVTKLPPLEAEKREWAMRCIFEIQRTGGLEKLLTGFGYAQEGVTVHNFWAEKPALDVKPAAVKWLALSKANEAMVVLASWSERQETAALRIDSASLGIQGRKIRYVDAETGRIIVEAEPGQPVHVEVPGPWGCRVMKVMPIDQ